MCCRLGGKILRRALRWETGQAWVHLRAMIYMKRLCSWWDLEVFGDNKDETFGCLKASRTDYIFLLCVPFIPGLNFLGERQAAREEKRNKPQQHLSPWKDPERGGKGKTAATSPTTCVFCPFPSILPTPPAHAAWDLKSVAEGPSPHNFKNNQPPSLPKPAQIHSTSVYFFESTQNFFSTTPLPKWSWVGGEMNTELAFIFLRDFLIQWGPQIIEFWVLVGCFIFFLQNFNPLPPEPEVLTSQKNWIVSVEFSKTSLATRNQRFPLWNQK